MLCYRDKAFCASDCTRAACPRFVSPSVEKDAERLGLPLALSDFSTVCTEYVPPAKPGS